MKPTNKRMKNSLIILAGLILFSLPQLSNAMIIFQNDDFATIESSGLLINSDDESSGNVILQFGQTLGESLIWSTTNARFELSDDLDLTNNQLTTFRVENVTAMPGGAGGLGAGGTGRVVELTVTDSVAPGCTGPSCGAGTYSWNGSIWKPLQGSITTSTATKIVTVGPVGRDYTTIAAAAAYLNTLSGGEMWIDPGTYPVTASVDLENIRVVGTDTSQTVISVTGAGQFQVKDTKFRDATLNVNPTAAYGINVKYSAASSSSVEYDQVDFIIASGKVMMDSSSGTPPLTIASFNNCTESSGAGTLVAGTGPSNLSTSSVMTVLDQLGLNALKLVDWPVTIIGGSNVVTSGTIITIPDRTILISPGMNIQTAINSLGANGGVIKLLIGTHDITNELQLNDNNIEVIGEGPGTIVRAQTGTWTGSVTGDNCAIQVGPANGTSPRTSDIIRNFRLQVGPNIHGICVNGGSENKVIDMTIESIGVKSGTRTAMVFTDGSSAAGSRFTASRNIITTNIAANRWVDGLHVDGNADLPGQLFGYGNGIADSIISETIVNEAQETSYAFSQVSASSVFSNRARNIGFSASAFGMFFNDATDVMVINNTMEGANAAATGISLFDNVDNSVFLGNAVRGGPVNYSVGINVAGATSAGNIIVDNEFNAVSTTLSDAGTSTKLETNHHRSTSNPTVNDDISDGYGVGTLWINTSAQRMFVLTDSTIGAAVWLEPGAGGAITGTSSNTFTLDNDNTGGNVTLQFGGTLAETLTWNSTASQFDLSDDLSLAGGLSLPAGTGTAAPIQKHLSVTQTNVTSNNITANSCGNYATITVTGAVIGDTVTATPTAQAGGIETVNLIWNATVTAANTVTIRACVPGTGNVNTANTQTWRIDVWGH